MPLREDILAPILGDNPSGIDLRYDKLLIYDQIKEARREDDDLSQGDWQIPRKTADFPLVVKLAQDAIATVSKDLQLAAWLTEALLQTEGFAGLREGLELCLGLMTRFWHTLYPASEDGDLEFRAAPLYWISVKLEPRLFSVPITAAGYSWNDWARGSTAGISRERITREALEKAVDETPGDFYLKAARDLDGCIEALADLDKFCLERFGDQAPTFDRLNRTLAHLRRTIDQLLEKKRENESDPMEEEPVSAASGPDSTDAEKRSRVFQLFDDAERLTTNSRFAHARELLDIALKLNPTNIQARKLRKLVHEHLERQQRAEILGKALTRADDVLAIENSPEELDILKEAQRLDVTFPELTDKIHSIEEKNRSGAKAEIPQSAGTTIVRVFYATDRLQLPSVTGKVQFGKQRSLLGSLHYGRCEVSIPKTHKLGRLETPSIMRLEFRPDPAKHIVLSGTISVEEKEFFEQVKESVARSAAKDAFIFVHGYNVSFENAARRTGQMAYDLDFVGAPIFYSWPSNGKTADYPKDETNVTWSTPHLQQFLTLLAQNTSAKRIYVIAHSMGNRAVCDALKLLSYDPACQLKLTHLVLAAPDIDADTFRELAAMLQKLSARITLYESSKDLALLASKKLHGNPRAGEPLLILPGLDTIDASAIDTDFLGHSYFSDTWPLLSDIHSILFEDQPPERRFGLAAREDPVGKYYAFRA